MFWDQARLNYDTFIFVVSIIAPFLQKKDIHLRDCINVEICLVISLNCLASRNKLISSGEQSRIPDSMVSIIV